MRQFRFDYSLKNIPIPSQDAYLRNLIEKVESVLKRMRWKAHFFLKGHKISDQNNPFGLPSSKTLPTILEMKSFENDVINLIENIKIRNAENKFQRPLASDLKKINSSPKIFVFADKTRNIYETLLDTYNKLMHDKATITTSNTNSTKHYIGMTASTFKKRYRNHIKSFNHKRYSNDTELSKYIWKLKDDKQDFDITWSVLKQSISYTRGSKRCNLCLEEKLCILKNKNKQNLLNKKSEIVSTCNHRKKLLIYNLRN